MVQQQNAAAPAFKDVPAVRLNYRYEADVPAPSGDPNAQPAEERNPGVQSDFDAGRPQELLDRTLSSPDKRHVLSIYHRITDVQAEFRLDLYSAEGKLLRKLTSDGMAVHFPDTIVWSPDSNSLAFVAMTRSSQPEPGVSPTPGLSGISPAATPLPQAANTYTAIDNSNAESASESPAPQPTPAAPTGIMTFRSEQIYMAAADGTSVRPITQNEGLIYFYYTWSPDSTMLAALASSSREWKYGELMSAAKGEIMTPQGRLRIIEKNGRERRLDDNMTAVRPVWSSDSTKVATAFDTQIRVYDASGTNPTQAAVPLRNQLLISSQAYDLDQQRKLQAANENMDANSANATPHPTEQPLSTLPDEKLLVSYNPIVEIAWPSEDLLYLKTAYVKRMQNQADSAMSFARWHRLVFTLQPAAPAR
ncbi:MAG: hypothetical protein ABIV21_05005 [Pyrinomonadaceae bacterium]